MRIHAIQTGTVAIHERQRAGRGRGPVRLAMTVADRRFTEPLPILAWLIEHPDGLVLVDTGETARALEPGYLPAWNIYYRLAVREQVTADQEIGPQIEALGFSTADVRHVVLTHMHTDHAGGLHHFTDNEILVTRTELEFASGLRGRARGYVANKHWPEWFSPRTVELEPDPLGPFPRSLRLTSAGDVTLVPLPGHTPGQIGVLVDEGNQAVLMAGDSSYTQELMLRGKADGVGADEEAERLTHERIREFAAATPTVYLVAHDPETGTRLAERQPVPATQPSRASSAAAGTAPSRSSSQVPSAS